MEKVTAIGAIRVLLPLLLGLSLLFIRVCADGGAMGSAYRACHCRGIEWQLYDHIAADGPRRTLCFGIVRSRFCSQSRDGSPIPCP